MCSEENRFLHPTTDMEFLLEKETTVQPEDVPANYHPMVDVDVTDIIMCSSSEENTFLHLTIGMSVSPKGKDITVLKIQYEKEKREIEEEEEECVGKKIELRTTTKKLILKKKDTVLKKFPILSQKNADLIVTAENKFKEIRSIYVLKKKFIEKNKTLKEHIFGLELIEHRYRCETERLDKNKKKGK